MRSNRLMQAMLCLLLAATSGAAQKGSSEAKPPASPGDRMLAEYFRTETAKLSGACLTNIKTLDDWTSRRDEYRRQLLEMLSLDPLPEKTDLKAAVTGKIDQPDIIVEKVHFQSRPGLYVTGNLYLPKKIEKPAPAVLYLCGHGAVKKDGVSFGNKVHYQHHGIWFARHGYVCLTIDSLQLGEIEGIHHGTHRYDMWWWNSRGYTPAGVEAWNCVRAIDYLHSRKEVDPERIGATGRSGGGAYSWFVAAIDDRVKVAVPVAGITDLENHVVDGVVEGHCDCMYFVNTYRWDYPQLAAMIAPRPLLISNTDKDRIFPLDGVLRTHEKVRKIYKLYGAENNLGLHITEGPHADTQELYTHAFVWLDRFLMGERRPIEGPAEKRFEPEQLKVFDKLPEDQINTKVHETFVAEAPQPKVPENKEEWAKMRDQWLKSLREKVFRGWPEDTAALDVKQVFSVERHGVRLTAIEFTSQSSVRLRLYFAHHGSLNKAKELRLNVYDSAPWRIQLSVLRAAFEKELEDEPQTNRASEEVFTGHRDYLAEQNVVVAYFAPRGCGTTSWDSTEKKLLHNRRRFMLLGQTLDGMRIWDTRRAIQVLRTVSETKDLPITVVPSGTDTLALYATLLEPPVQRLELDLAKSHRDTPDLLNVLRCLDLPAAVVLAADHSPTTLWTSRPEDWKYVLEVQGKLGWDKSRLSISSPIAP